MNNKISKKTYRLALVGICLALTVVANFAASIIPGSELTLYAVAGLFTGVAIMETGLKGGVLLYIGAVILSFVLIPNKMALLPYALFFGLYGFIKYFSEKVQNPVGQIVLKVLFFEIIFTIAFWCLKDLFFENIKLPDVSVWIIMAAGTVMFLLYDYIFTLAIAIYKKRIKREDINFKLSGEDDDIN